MAEHLDDLLDEVETRFCRSASLSSNLTTNQDRRQNNDEPMGRTKDQEKSDRAENIDAVLQEILDDDWETGSSHIPIATNACAKDFSPPVRFKKCCPVFVGGSSIISGIGTSISKRACDQLRCTSCDFRVAMFDDHEWHSSCDYLFFRYANGGWSILAKTAQLWSTLTILRRYMSPQKMGTLPKLIFGYYFILVILFHIYALLLDDAVLRNLSERCLCFLQRILAQ
ncbi:cilia- and flagella-associated protein 418 isoform X1 [Brachyhypopomus gauderio]|uniref:cilia- and flagella-associated protein 418 isoform X1 n=1 Tax=Brachyhypopomus gauderio TaxID=698409 RepID=UPI004042EEA6